ncbi:hypothetical protein GAGA_1464 [Paraglaciecola agarilytica NO2]|uniref:Transposase n=1 Tax=Paraglaciecola agarilytica NO2 TaxID=1125747 RepID=A0ABQ0I4N9_9ALTE|nr:hypothetical protein GAGA_1464 [Paraglaciecola agarilytica NO2]
MLRPRILGIFSLMDAMDWFLNFNNYKAEKLLTGVNCIL